MLCYLQTDTTDILKLRYSRRRKY